MYKAFFLLIEFYSAFFFPRVLDIPVILQPLWIACAPNFNQKEYTHFI